MAGKKNKTIELLVRGRPVQLPEAKPIQEINLFAIHNAGLFERTASAKVPLYLWAEKFRTTVYQLLFKAQQHTLLLAICGEVLKKKSKNLASLSFSANALRELNRSQDAIEFLEHYLKIKGTDAVHINSLACTYKDLGQCRRH